MRTSLEEITRSSRKVAEDEPTRRTCCARGDQQTLRAAGLASDEASVSE